MRSARNNIDHSEVGASAIRSLRRKFVIMTMIALVITLAALLPLLWVFRKKRPEKSGVKGAATPSPGEAVSGKTDKTTIYRTKPE